MKINGASMDLKLPESIEHLIQNPLNAVLQNSVV